MIFRSRQRIIMAFDVGQMNMRADLRMITIIIHILNTDCAVSYVCMYVHYDCAYFWFILCYVGNVGIKVDPLINSLRPRLNRRPFADDIFKCIFLNENEWVLLRISLKFVPKVRINNIPASVQIMAWRLPGDKPLSKPMMVSLLTHISVTRAQWVKSCFGDLV